MLLCIEMSFSSLRKYVQDDFTFDVKCITNFFFGINCYPLIGSCAGHNEVHCVIMWATCVLVGGSLYSLGCGVGAAFQHYSFDMISSAPSF